MNVRTTIQEQMHHSRVASFSRHVQRGDVGVDQVPRELRLLVHRPIHWNTVVQQPGDSADEASPSRVW
jgi:hypothetical protein